MLKKISLILVFASLVSMTPLRLSEANNTWDTARVFTVWSTELPVYTKPAAGAKKVFNLHRGVELEPLQVVFADGYRWFEVKIGRNTYWTPATAPQGVVNVIAGPSSSIKLNEHIIDAYGIMEKEHNFAVKMVKYEDPDPVKWGADGHIETYRKVGDEYVFQNKYPVRYPKAGPKDRYGDLKTVGGNAVRYLYRTTRSGMNGYNKHREHFGVYKVSFPMPHDALPILEEGRMSTWQYNNIRSINQYNNGQFYPHPGSMLGADIVVHTDRKGSRGCIMVENEAMSFLYHNDLVSANDTEIIPFIIYDEGVTPPPVGELL